MLTIKAFCEKYQSDPSRVLEFVFGVSGDHLPKARGYTGYFVEVKEDCLEFTNEKFGILRKQIPFSYFQSAEFGMGSGQLWLQCTLAGEPFIFCLRRKVWKSELGKLLLEKIGQNTEILGKKDYDRYTGKLFLYYAIKTAF